MINQFIPLTVTQDGKYSIARNEASTITAPYQGGNSMPFFWIERKGEVFGAIRNLNLAGSSQEKMFDLLKEKALDSIV